MIRYARIALAAAAAAALLAPASALAAPPTVTTGGATNVTQTTATLNGNVNPKGNPTFTYFQFGTTAVYGGQTPEVDRGAGGSAVKVPQDIAGLAAFETYHYRLVARYGERVVLGADKTFRTDRQPLGLSLMSNPLTIRPGQTTVISGAISGTGNGGRLVQLQANPFPFSGFVNVGNAQQAATDGSFSFPILNQVVNTLYRVRVPSKPDLASPEAPVNVMVDLTADVQRSVKRGRKVKFHGKVTPSNAGAPVFVQRQFKGQWITVKQTQLGDASKYRVTLKPFRDGRFRVVVIPGTAYVGDTSATLKIDVRRR